MLPWEKGMDITKNIRLIEWLKSELLMSVAKLHRLLTTGFRGSQEALADALAGIIIDAYLLARRLGIGFAVIDRRITEQINLSLEEDDQSQELRADLSAMAEYIKNRDDG